MHHPQSEILEKYSVGELTAQLSSMVSAHFDECQECRSRHQEILARESQQLAAKPCELSSLDLDNAFESIMGRVKIAKRDDQLNSEDESQVESQGITLCVGGQSIRLPRSMNFLSNQKIQWKEFGEKSAIAPVLVTPKGNFYLIYIGPGESVPQHSHSGVEYSYVVAGSYNDGISIFNTGDFSFSNHKTSHSPQAISEDGCLVISWVEGRLNYFDGLLRPLNSILWWYLHKI